MNQIQIGKKFEKKAFNFLRKKYKNVYWLSKNKKTNFDFKILMKNKEYFGDAKYSKDNGKIKVRDNQITVDFLVYNDYSFFFVEVKKEGTGLQKNQIEFLEYLNILEIPNFVFLTYN